jgi:hypothetical protein
MHARLSPVSSIVIPFLLFASRFFSLDVHIYACNEVFFRDMKHQHVSLYIYIYRHTGAHVDRYSKMRESSRRDVNVFLAAVFVHSRIHEQWPVRVARVGMMLMFEVSEKEKSKKKKRQEKEERPFCTAQ